MSAPNGHSTAPEKIDFDNLDVVLVGAGFGGTLMLWRLRSMGFNVRLVERNSRSGGVWSSNNYPGARVDSDVPTFEFSDPELWNDWKWTERFPGQPEILTYFEYVTNKLKLDKDTSYNTMVNSARWDEVTKRWTIGSVEGRTFRARSVVWCTGYFTKLYVPDFPGLEKFKGPVLHPGTWPAEGVDLAGKRVGIIGTGASAIQIIQDTCKIAEHLTVFQRTPNTALPAVQRQLPPGGVDKATYPAAFSRLLETTSGFLYSPKDQSALDTTPEEREAFFNELYRVGGFSFYLGSYNDILTNIQSNHIAYDFWRRKVWERVHDKSLAELLAPVVPPHSFGAKRPCLEQCYYEAYNRSNVELVNVNEDKIEEITATGVKTTSGLHELDVLITATGYDAVIGAYKDFDVRGTGGRSLYEDAWANGTVYTYLGLMTHGFPNSFYIFGPQSPFANGPTCVEVQAAALLKLFQFMRDKGYQTVESTAEADKAYKKEVNDAGAATVLGIGAGWFWGTNVPGDRNEAQIYMKGIPSYRARTDQEADAGYPNLVFTS